MMTHIDLSVKTRGKSISYQIKSVKLEKKIENKCNLLKF